MSDNHNSHDNQIFAFGSARAALLGIHHLQLVWSAHLRLVGPGVSPWERLHDRLLWLGFIAWLRQDIQSKNNVQSERGVQDKRDAPQ